MELFNELDEDLEAKLREEEEKIRTEIMEDIDKIFSEDGIIRKFKPDYAPRESQIDASKRIMDTITHRDHAILEGPCGFGKTFAYLVPVFMHTALMPGNIRTVIVTNGISLQEQLFYKDLPFINKLFKEMYSKDISFAMLKGKGNFICMDKMAELMMTRNMSGAGTSKILQLYNEKKIPNGDISHLDFVPDYATLSEVACTEEGECKGSQCGFYETCYYQQARQKAAVAKVVVTNYHMLFSDLKTQGRILGEYDIVVFDEAHEVSGIYRDFLEEKISAGTLVGIRNKFSEISKQDEEIRDNFVSKIAFDWVLKVADAFFEKVKRSLFVDPKKDSVKLLDATMPLCLYPEQQKEFLNAISHIRSSAQMIMEFCKMKVENIMSSYDSEYELDGESREEYNHYAGINNRVATQFEKLERINSLIVNYKDIVGNNKYVYWVENKEEKIMIQLKPVTVADELYNNFFSLKDLSCIVTSATLSVDGNFTYIKEQLGLNNPVEGKSILEFIGKSPFDLETQELWYLPENVIDGDSRNAVAFQQLLPHQICDILKATKGGALCLFTSYYNLNLAHAAVSKALPKLVIFKQGDMPRTKLIEEFKENKDSVLFATRSFFTGVDIPGDSLRCLVIDKFPFPSPGDPVMMKVQKLLGDKTFNKHYIPEMVITLKQAVGRGVRTVSDRCVVAVLDGRMATASYRASIFNSFPYQKTGTRNIEDVKKFLEG